MTIRSIIRSPVRGVLSGVLAGGGGLLGTATAALGVAPLHYWDFLNNRALFNSIDVGGVTSTPGWSYTRADAQSAYAQDLAGNLIPFATGVLRRTDRGVLIEGSRTNLFLNSTTGGTQSVTVTAAAHTLSFYGTGTITLSGVSVAGPLVGTGANQRVTLTFTPTAGSLTLTVTGSCTNVNLELGAFASSWIPTVGASATRAADQPQIYPVSMTYPMTFHAEWERTDTGATEYLLALSTSGAANQSILFITSADRARLTVDTASVRQADILSASTLSGGLVHKFAARVATNDVQIATNGTLGTADTSATVPPTGTLFDFAAVPHYGYIRRAAIFNSALNDAALTRATT